MLNITAKFKSEEKNLVSRETVRKDTIDGPSLEATASKMVLNFHADFRFFRWTDKREIAAGVTPEILEACPRERGRTCVSFSRTSRERPCIEE
jgi:hypothetical protein